jgi:hypothetical protein
MVASTNPKHSPPTQIIQRETGTGRIVVALLVFVLGLYAAAAALKEPGRLIGDADHGYQLAGAVHILNGEHPFIHFKDIYGPLVFYASAFAQWLTDGRVIGEVLLNIGALGLAYVLLFASLRALHVSQWRACIVVLAAASLAPELYRYYLTLCPLLCFAAFLLYARKPGFARVAVIAAAVCIAGLFRADIGAYCLLTAVCFLLFNRRDKAGLFRVVQFLGCSVMFYLPWLTWLTLHGALTDYIVASLVEAVRTADALSLPLPSLGESVVDRFKGRLWIPYVLFGFGLLVAVFRWAKMERTDRPLILSLLILCSFYLLLCSHRIDWQHCRDALALLFVLAGWASTQCKFLPRVSGPLVSTCSIVTFVGIAIFSFSLKRARLDPSHIAEKLAVYSGEKSDIVEHVRGKSPDHVIVRAIDMIQKTTTFSERVLSLYGYPNITYFAERLVAGERLAIYPGYFDSEDDQLEMISNLKRQSVGIILVETSSLDGRDERSIARFAQPLLHYIDTNFRRVGVIESLDIFAPMHRAVALDTGQDN